MEIGNIVKGHVNEFFGLNKDISEERLKICKICPLYLNKFGGICNSKLWMDPITEEISFTEQDGYVRGCSCRLLAKTSLPDEQCPAGKW